MILILDQTNYKNIQLLLIIWNFYLSFFVSQGYVSIYNKVKLILFLVLSNKKKLDFG